ncbi:DNA-processing protein DprA [Arcanobacterium bovis]|uniref:DNA-processing protein DprA n=1 Tax=Arcanobacterium bovis TaxID=2529275 RepID=A0A4Q9V008_9ACTO|nr:DNA-processing protein DprA [Arcanobacterium bovis]TBW20695.1 DNA-processing protein DprA [Arcanobacterium bovis]
MSTIDDLAKITAIIRVKNRSFSQTKRSEMLLRLGIDETLSEICGGGLFIPSNMLEQARNDVHRWLDSGYKIVSLLDADYPSFLTQVHESPALLFYTGRLRQSMNSVSIVGSRHANQSALNRAQNIAEFLAHRGYTIISGLAKGIDTAAHQSALDADGYTVAVMGTGIDKTYPAENIRLRQKIEEQNGCIVTQFLPGSPPTKQSFPMRNVTMSGLSQATIVVTASEYSGTRGQAKRALLHGRNVFLLPDVVDNTQWGKEMLSQPGVYAVTSYDDLYAHLNTIDNDVQLLASIGKQNSD